MRATDAASGAYVLVEHEFAGGETVTIDCASEAVTIDGTDARAEVALGSDFFALNPGSAELGFSGCSSHITAFHERRL